MQLSRLGKIPLPLLFALVVAIVALAVFLLPTETPAVAPASANMSVADPKTTASSDLPSVSLSVPVADPRAVQVGISLSGARASLAESDWGNALYHLKVLDKMSLTVTETKEVRAGFYAAYFGQGVSWRDTKTVSDTLKVKDLEKATAAFQSAQFYATGKEDLDAVRTELDLAQNYARGLEAYSVNRWVTASNAFGYVAGKQKDYLKVAEKLTATNFNYLCERALAGENSANLVDWQVAKGFYADAAKTVLGGSCVKGESATVSATRIAGKITAEVNRLKRERMNTALANTNQGQGYGAQYGYGVQTGYANYPSNSSPQTFPTPSPTSTPIPPPTATPTRTPTRTPSPTPSPTIPVATPVASADGAANGGSYTVVPVPSNVREVSGTLTLAKPPTELLVKEIGLAESFEVKVLQMGFSLEYRFLQGGGPLEKEGVKVEAAVTVDGKEAMLLTNAYDGQQYFVRGRKVFVVGSSYVFLNGEWFYLFAKAPPPPTN